MMSYYSVQQTRKGNRSLVFFDEITGVKTIGIFHLQDGAKAICKEVQYMFDRKVDNQQAYVKMVLSYRKVQQILRFAIVIIAVLLIVLFVRSGGFG